MQSNQELTDKDREILCAELAQLQAALERRKEKQKADSSENMLPYILTDQDYIVISQKLKDDIYDVFMAGEMEGFLKECELEDSNFLIHIDNGGILDICYSIWIDENEAVPVKKDDITTSIVDEINIFYHNKYNKIFGAELPVDRSKIVF